MSSNSRESQVHPEIAKVEDPYLSAVLLCFSRVLPAVLNAAIDLNLFDIIAKAQSSCDSSFSASEIASLLPNQHPQLANRLERILPLLASYSLLNCSIRTNEDGCKGCNCDPNNNNHFENVHGIPPYDYMEKNAELNDIFYKAVIHAAPLELKRALKLYKGFEGVSTLVDVGGGAGETLKQILPKYPSMKGINFDLPLVIQKAPPHPGIEQIAGDMFESVPTGDAILVKFVCHNWADEDCIKFLRNFHKALPQHGKVIVFEYIIPEVPNPSYISKHTCTLDNVMFLAHGGRERTQKEFENLCKSSGFSKFHVASSDISSTLGVMEFYK
ncbi:hypothetical protein JHK82_026427 [Glycine max]|nr:hypothetical protein JHK82_026427 [Glycine max]